MAELPWLTIVGVDEDGTKGLTPASLAAIETAEIVMAPARHLSLLTKIPAKTVEWPVPFADGLDKLRTLRGQRVTVLASGDPFWFGAGSVLARVFKSEEWTALPGRSCFSLASSHLGWSIEKTMCFGLHAAPFTRLRPYLTTGERFITTLRDGDAPTLLAGYLVGEGFGDSILHIMEALGGPREKISIFTASDLTADVAVSHPVCVAVEVHGNGPTMSRSSGQQDDWFENDGQITKRPVRALTLSALAPRKNEYLWDVGGGSGSIAIEWLLADASLQATSIEADPERAKRIRRNAERLGVDRLEVVEGTVPEALNGLNAPDAVFIGGGLSPILLDCVTRLKEGTRLVANAVTLETEALLLQAHRNFGGELFRFEIAQASPIGQKRGWRAAYPIVQWSTTL